MKLTIKRITHLLLCGSLLLGAGCSSFLDEEDPSNLTPDSYFTIPEHAEASVNAIYENLRFIGNGAGIFSQNFQLLEALSGTSTTETGQNSDLNNLLGLAYNGDNVHIRQWWQSLYRGISNANLSIQRIPTIPLIDQETMSRTMGEAYFLRALHYYWAVRLWGAVPLLTEPIDSYNSPDMFPGRTSVDSVYGQIVADLQAAENSSLPETATNGRASKGAVKSLLASVYLTMAGQPLNRGAEYYQLAANKAREVIDAGRYNLFTNYDDLHNPGTKNRVEHIFSVQYAAGIASAPFQNILLPNFGGVSAYGTQIGSTVPTTQFYNSYEPGDRRVEEQEFFYTRYYTNGYQNPIIELNAPYIFKHFDVAANGTLGVQGTAQSSMNWPLIRFAEVLLIYAEAQNEVSGPTAEARNALKRIRDRANLTTPEVGGFTQASFREAVWRERWHELCYEGITWFDMLRLRRVYNERTNGFDNFVGHRFPNGATLAERHLLLPLPTMEYNNNPNLRPNNPGY